MLIGDMAGGVTRAGERGGEITEMKRVLVSTGSATVDHLGRQIGRASSSKTPLKQEGVEGVED